MYKNKYLKYKQKYLQLKYQYGGDYIWEYTESALGAIDEATQKKLHAEYKIFLDSGKKKNYKDEDAINFKKWTLNGKGIQRIEMTEKEVQAQVRRADLFPSREYFNKAVQSFGVNLTLTALHTFCSAYPRMQPISVGSGNGILEFCYAKKYTESKETILCVDPAPLSFNSDGIDIPFQAPKYGSVESLLSANPQLRRNCVLVLNWPNPNESTYDFDAVQALEPCGFFTTLEHWGDSGGAGGSSFHRFLRDCEHNPAHQPYRLAHRIRLNKSEQDICIEWWHRSDLPALPPHSLPLFVDSMLENKDEFMKFFNSR
jgi:hypothetical protein